MRYFAVPGMSSACRLDIALRIDRRAVVQHFEMHMRSSGTSGRTDAGDHLPARHLVTDVDQHLAVMTIARRITVAVIDLHQIAVAGRSEEHTSELQSLMRISYAVFCLKKKKQTKSK